MNSPILSNNWYRVAALRPRLRSHADLRRHRYRGQVWYLLRDPISNRVHRFSSGARLFIAAMDGQRSVDALWALTQRRLGDDAPTQDEVIQLLGQLHAADMLQSDTLPDSAETFDRGQRIQRQRSRLNPMALRLPLWDPQAFLDRIAPLTRVLWSRPGGLLWLAVVLPALVLLPSHWEELTGNFSDRVLASDNLLLLWLVFPLIKLLHEMGHAVATHRGGGEVHDLGIVMLVLIPVPYVEASAANVFPSKFERAMVAAAGMAVEVFVAALSFYAWLAVEPGLVRALLFNVMLVAGVSTLVFNGNPLLRYDAYYMLADLIEMPNLASRSTRWWGWLADRRLFGVQDATAPEADPVEQGWLTFYGAASFAYRTLVTVSIAIFIAGQFFFVGVVLALWAVASMALWPLVKGLRHVVRSPALRARRPRVVGVLGGGAAVLALLLFVVPAPLRHVVEGVVWLPEQAQLRSAQEGFLEKLLIEPGARAQAGERVFQVRNPRLEAQIVQLKARVAELQAAYTAQLGSDRASAATALEQLQAERQALAVAQERADGLSVRAAVDGVLVVPLAADLPGRWLRIGDLVGYIVPDAAAARPPLVRVVVPQDAVDAVRHDTLAISLKAAFSTSAVQQGRIAREIPAGDEYLPSRVLAVDGGGQIATDPRDSHGVRSLERGFQFDIEVRPPAGDSPVTSAPAYFGERVHVRFEHSPQPLGVQAITALRRLLLSHFQA